MLGGPPERCIFWRDSQSRNAAVISRGVMRCDLPVAHITSQHGRRRQVEQCHRSSQDQVGTEL